MAAIIAAALGNLNGARDRRLQAAAGFATIRLTEAFQSLVGQSV